MAPEPDVDAVVLVMGIPGAGKTAVAEQLVADGYRRLNRDERGGSLRGLSDALDETLAADGRVVLDNTYVTRASRSRDRGRRPAQRGDALRLARHAARAGPGQSRRADARPSRLPAEPGRARSSREPGVMAPTSQMRMLRELEPPSADEGFTAVERIAFERAQRLDRPHSVSRGRSSRGRAVMETRNQGSQSRRASPRLRLAPGGSADDLASDVARLSSVVTGLVEAAVCPHGGGAPICWCRPPLPGLPLAFARAHDVDPSRSSFIGTSTAHRTLATTLGARYVEVDAGR